MSNSSLNWRFLRPLLSVVLLYGCGRAPAPSADSVTPANSAPTTSAAPSASAPNPTGEGGAGAESGGVGAASLVQAESADADFASPDQEPGPAAPTAQPPVAQAATPAVAARPRPTLSAEQQAKWSRAPWTPWELLSIREEKQPTIVRAAAASPDGSFYVLGGKTVTQWSLKKSEPEHTFWTAQPDDAEHFITALAISPDGKWLAAGDSRGQLTTWNLSTRTQIASKELLSNDVRQIAISPDSQLVALTTFDSEIKVYSADSLTLKKSFEVSDRGLERAMFIDDKVLAVAGEKITSWDTTTGQPVAELSSGRYNMVLNRSPDKQLLAVGEGEGLKLVRASDRSLVTELPNSIGSRSLLEFSPDGKYFAAVNGANIQIWDIAARQVVQAIDTTGPAIVGFAWLPQTQLAIVVNELGRTRVWGTPAAGQPLGLQPVHKPISLVSGPTAGPATSAQFLAAIDLRSFPRLLPQETVLNEPNIARYKTSATREDAELFYRYFLGEAGWQEMAPTPQSMPGSLEFAKEGYQLLLAFNAGADGPLEIDLTHLGNFDARTVPQLSGPQLSASQLSGATIKPVFSSSSTVIMTATQDLLELETTLLRRMQADGWIPFTRLHTSQSEEADVRSLDFLKNATMLNVSIRPDPNAAAKTYFVQYAGFTTSHSLPVPRDCELIEFDGSTAPQIVATTSLSLEEARKFYQTELEAQGWVIPVPPQAPKDGWAGLEAVHGQSDLDLRFFQLPSGATLILAGDGLQDGSWQLGRLLGESAKTETEATADSDESPAAAESPSLEAADVPLPAGAEKVEYSQNEETISFTLANTPLAKVAESVTESLGKLGFKADDSGIRGDDYTLITFERGETEVDLRATSRNGNAEVQISGDGLSWTKALPGPKKRVAYASWLRDNGHPATLRLLDQYVQEMKAIAP